MHSFIKKHQGHIDRTLSKVLMASTQWVVLAIGPILQDDVEHRAMQLHTWLLRLVPSVPAVMQIPVGLSLYSVILICLFLREVRSVL